MNRDDTSGVTACESPRKGWMLVPSFGTRVKANHPVTPLNPEPTFEVFHVRANGSPSGFDVRGENTCWFGLSMIEPADDSGVTAARAPLPLPEFEKVSYGVDSVMRPVEGMAISEHAFRQWAKDVGIVLADGVAACPAPDTRKPWERSDWTCARARVDSEGMHCPEDKCADCPNRTSGVTPSDEPKLLVPCELPGYQHLWLGEDDTRYILSTSGVAIPLKDQK